MQPCLGYQPNPQDGGLFMGCYFKIFMKQRLCISKGMVEFKGMVSGIIGPDFQRGIILPQYTE